MAQPSLSPTEFASAVTAITSAFGDPTRREIYLFVHEHPEGVTATPGRLEDLIAIEDQTEIVLKDASPELVARIEELVRQEGGAEFVRTGKPRTTLERLFLREIR